MNIHTFVCFIGSCAISGLYTSCNIIFFKCNRTFIQSNFNNFLDLHGFAVSFILFPSHLSLFLKFLSLAVQKLSFKVLIPKFQRINIPHKQYFTKIFFFYRNTSKCSSMFVFRKVKG